MVQMNYYMKGKINCQNEEDGRAPPACGGLVNASGESALCC